MKTVVLVMDIEFWLHSIGSHTRIQRLAKSITEQNNLIIFMLRRASLGDDLKFAALGLKNTELVYYEQYLNEPAEIQLDIGMNPFFKEDRNDDFSKSLSSYLKKNQPDVLILEYIRLSYLLDACPPRLATILDMHDVMSLRTISFRQAGLRASIEMDAKTERSILERFSRILAISRADQAYLTQKMGLVNTIYVPCSVEDAPRRVPSGDGTSLVFFGGRSAANIAGLRWFLAQAWPILVEDGFVLHVVGPVCEAFPIPPAGVHLHGQQDDLRRFLAAADIAINPVFVGGGLKIKCLEALAAGLPCVTTVEGAAGLDSANQAGLAVASSRLEFVSAIRHFASSPADRQAVAFLAPLCMQQEFSDSAAYAPVAAYIATLMPETPHASRGATAALVEIPAP